MAKISDKNSDKKPGRLAGFEGENTGGVLSGLLAEEDALDRRTLFRIGSWGVGAVGAVVLAVLSNQSGIILRRDQIATDELARQAAQFQIAAKENRNEARRLASAVDTLNSDRDRLYSRVTVLEQGLDSMTGAIARQSAAAVGPPSPPPQPAPVATIEAAEPSHPSGSKAGPAPTAAMKPADKPVAETNVQPGPATPAKIASNPPADSPAAPAASAPTVAATTPPATPAPAAATPPPVAGAPLPPPTPATPLVAAKSMMAPPDAAATKLIEPEKPEKAASVAPKPEVVASAPPVAFEAESEATDTSAPKIAVQRTEFGVDVGGANSVGGLRALWRGLLKSRSNAALTTLHPIIVIKESNSGLGMQLRLVAGPLSDAAAAAKICASLADNERGCETAVYDGQRLAMTAAEERETPSTKPAPPAAAAKPYSRRRGSQKHAANDEAAKKPDPPPTTSSFSAFISKKLGN